MSELSPDEFSIATAGADPCRRKADADEARRGQALEVTSAPAAAPIADMVEELPSGEVPVGVVVHGPSYFRKLAIEWVYAPAGRRIVPRGAA